MEKIDQSNRSNNNSRVPAPNQGVGVVQDDFFSDPGQTVVITFHNDFGILAAAPIFQHDDGAWGFPPDAELPLASTEFLLGSCLAFVRGVPASLAKAANDAAADGEFWEALSILGRVYIETDKSFRQIGSASSYYSQQIHDFLLLIALDDEGGEG